MSPRYTMEVYDEEFSTNNTKPNNIYSILKILEFVKLYLAASVV